MPDARPVVAIVDDDASVGKALERLVRSLGLAASTFTSGDAFLRRVQGEPPLAPRCVILDMQMPGLNGLAVQDRLRELRSTAQVVFITAHDAPGMKERALAGGAIAYLRKPLTDDVLTRFLEGLVKEAEQRP